MLNVIDTLYLTLEVKKDLEEKMKQNCEPTLGTSNVAHCHWVFNGSFISIIRCIHIMYTALLADIVCSGNSMLQSMRHRLSDTLTTLSIVCCTDAASHVVMH